MWSIGRAAVALLSATTLSACGGEAASADPSTVGADGHATAGGERSVPALPDDTLALVPGDTTELLLVDLVAARAWSHFEVLRGWAARLSCLDAPPSHWLFDGTRRIIAASSPTGLTAGQTARSSGLVLFEGDFEAGSLDQALADAGRAAGRSPAPGPLPPASIRGRFELRQLDGLSVLRIDEQRFAVGDTAAIEALIALADGLRTDRFIDGALFREHASVFEGHAIGAVAQPSELYRQELSDELGGLGATALLRGLRPGSISAGLLLDDGLHAFVDASYETAQAAADAARTARQLYFQGNLLLRLTGMPRILEQAQATAEGTKVRYGLALTPAEIDQLRERVEWLLAASAEGRCDANPEAPQ